MFSILATVGGFLVNLLLKSQRIAANVDIARLNAEAAERETQARVITAAMAFRIYWLAWGLAAVPTAAWYAWGICDSMLWDGTWLPDVAALPDQLQHYADIVFSNIFLTGLGGAAAHGGLSLIERAMTRNFDRGGR